MKKTIGMVILGAMALGAGVAGAADGVPTPEEVFRHPPREAHVGVWWHWMGSQVTEEGIRKDLDWFQRMGVFSATVFGVADSCTPWARRIGNVPTDGLRPFDERWWKLFAFACREGKRRGIDIGLHNCPGYTSTGGPWIPSRLAMRELVFNVTNAAAQISTKPNAIFPVYNEDTRRYELPPCAARQTDVVEIGVARGGVKVAHIPMGAFVQPADWDTFGLECDKMNPEAVDLHLNHVIGELKRHLGSNLPAAGLRHVLLDSYEAGTPTWTPKMREEFKARRGYDCLEFLPILGNHTNLYTAAEVKKFRADFERTVKDLYRDVLFKRMYERLHAEGIAFSNEPYDGPFEPSEVSPFIDRIMTEFWYSPTGSKLLDEVHKRFNRLIGPGGRRHNVVEAEAFTGSPEKCEWTEMPANLKPAADDAFLNGVNRLIFHTATLQPWGDDVKPGVTMGRWGTHFGRNQTWAECGKPFFDYLARCQALLQWGKPCDAKLGMKDVRKISRTDGNRTIHFVVNKVSGESRFYDDTTGQWFDPVSGTIGSSHEAESVVMRLEDFTPALGDRSKSADPAVRYYSGTLTYRTRFDLPKAGGMLTLSFPDPADQVYVVRVNGRLAGTAWGRPWTVELSVAALKEKGNELEIDVTNSWRNRLIGDEQEPADCEFVNAQYGGKFLLRYPDWFKDGIGARPSKGRKCFTTWNYFTKDSKLTPSGLVSAPVLRWKAPCGRPDGQAEDAVFVNPAGDDADDGTAARPVKTVARAVSLARERTRRTVVLADGEYPVDAAVELRAGDAGLTVRAAHPGRATLTGAKKVTGWSPDAEDPGIVVAPFPFEPGEWRMPTLVVNGRAADLAAYPEYGGKERMRYFADEADAAKGNRTVLRYDANDLPHGRDFRDLDITSAFLFVPQEWCSSLCRIATNDWRHDTFVLRDRTDMPIGRFNQGYQIVNTRLGMDRPGRWMFEAAKRRILYRLRPGESAATLQATLSHAERLFNLVGARDIRFEGLVLEGCTRPFRRAKDDLPFACIVGEGSTNVVVEACEVRHSSGDGLCFNREGHISIRRCHIHDLGGGGVWLGYFGEVGEVSDCHVHHNGRYALGAAGVWAHMMHMTVVRNHVHDQPGCGMTLWTCHSFIASNHLHHTMRTIRDGGGLYGAQNFSMIRDNVLHDNGDWPGLYNDEGGRDTVYTGNRFDGDWWPIHMHLTQGIVITNNVFTCDGCAMRFSFQGAAHTVFRDNVINTTIPIEDDAYLENCDVWADNDIRLKQADGTYRSVGRLSLERRPAPPKGPAAVVAKPGAGTVSLDRDARGFASPGVPGARARLSSDGTNLCVEGFYEYNKFISYEGSVNLGETWGRHDAVRFFFDGFTVTAFVGRRVVSSDPTLVLDPATTYSEKMRSVGDGWARFGFRIPLARLGDLSFNAVSFNADHGEYKYFTPPVGGVEASGRLVLRPYVVDRCARTPAKASSYPGGSVQFVAEWVEKRSDLRGFALADAAGRRGFLLQPFAKGPALQPVERASESAHPDCYGISVENWALRNETTAAKEVALLQAAYDRGGTVKVRLEAEDGEFAPGNGTFAGRDGALFAAMAFDPKPLAVRPAAGDGRRSWELEFFVKPIVGAVKVRAAVSGKSAADAFARLASAPGGFDFKSVRAACHDAWNEFYGKSK